MSESVSSKSKTQYAKFALPLPLYCNFDYRIADNQPAKPGIRFRLPFGSRDKIGIMLAAQDTGHDVGSLLAVGGGGAARAGPHGHAGAERHSLQRRPPDDDGRSGIRGATLP